MTITFSNELINKSLKEVEFGNSPFVGLTCQEVAARLKQHGFNEITATKQSNFWLCVLRVLREPMLLLLLLGTALYFILGSTAEAVFLLFSVLLVVGITSYQEYKSEKALLMLSKLSSPRALVVRDGEAKRIPGREVVQDDILLVDEGDYIAADAVLLSSTNLLVDESILTGESLPVEKNALSSAAEFKRDTNRFGQVYAGSYVVRGNAVARVEATAMQTEMGKIGKSLMGVKIERTRLQRDTDALVRDFAIWGLVLCTLLAIFYGLMHADWLHGFLVGVTLAMAILPEEFPVVLSIFLALGAWRLSQKAVLTRRVPAVETLGSATVLCVDKTGTITQNRMSVASLFSAGEYHNVNATQTVASLPEVFHQLVEYGILASQRKPFDPMEQALQKFGETTLYNTEHLHNNWDLVHQYPLSKELLAISLVWKSTQSSSYVIAAKGAPEAIFDLCHLSKQQISELLPHINNMAQSGLRILGVAKANFQHQELPAMQHDFNFEFLGFVGLSDPIRPEVFGAVQKCYQAGVRVIMLTGDYSGTAQQVAQQIGLRSATDVVTGTDLMGMHDLELQQKIRTVNVFARILPEQKLRLVNALKANGEIVAMTGDGINDAPALKSAHIGIAMGERGSDVARESAALVLLQDNFNAIVAAIKLGRRIYTNIKKAVTYLLAVHMPVIGISLIPILLKWPPLLLPVHIVFLELVIDPTCSVVFEAEEEDVDSMLRPPRAAKEPLLDAKTLCLGLWQGLGMLIAVLAMFFIARGYAFNVSKTRAMVFVVIVLSSLLLTVASRARVSFGFLAFRWRNKPLWWVVISALILLALTLYVPFLRHLFAFEVLSGANILLCMLLAGGCFVWLQVVELIGRYQRPVV